MHQMSDLVKMVNNIQYSKETMDDGRLKLSVEVPNERFELVKEKVYQRLAPSVNISGFRPGQAPKNMIVAQLGPTLFEETLGELIPQATLEIIRHEDLVPLDQISYNVEKVAEGSGVKYTAIFSVLPDFELPDLSTIKVEKPVSEVTTEEVDKVIDQMFQEYKAQAEKDEGQNITEVNDVFAASLNLGVKTVDQLREKIQEELKRQKEMMDQNKYVDSVIKEIVERSDYRVPDTMINQEVDRKEKMYTDRIEKLGMKLEDFLKNQKTSLEELRKGWKKEAEQTIRAEIVLMKLSKKFDVKVTDDEIDSQMEQITDENLKKQYEGPNGRAYIRTVLLRQKVIQQLLKAVAGETTQKPVQEES